MYMKTFRSNQFALTNLYLSVSCFFFFIEFKNTEEASNTTGERTFSCFFFVREKVVFWSNFSATFTPCLGKLLASTVQCHRSRRNVTTSWRSISFLMYSEGDPSWPWKIVSKVFVLFEQPNLSINRGWPNIG